LNDAGAAECVAAERALVAALEGDCHSPIAALASVKGGRLHMAVAVGGRDGAPPVVRTTAEGPRGDADALVAAVMNTPFGRAARDMLHPKT
jgi:hydroxymethylbilane synthase